MPRFILRYRGSPSTQAAEVSRIQTLPDTTILDSSSGPMMLVDGPEEHLRAAIQDMPGWIMTPEQTVPLPDARQKIVRPPDNENNS
jgi:hypothetical protein